MKVCTTHFAIVCVCVQVDCHLSDTPLTIYIVSHFITLTCVLVVVLIVFVFNSNAHMQMCFVSVLVCFDIRLSPVRANVNIYNLLSPPNELAIWYAQTAGQSLHFDDIFALYVGADHFTKARLGFSFMFVFLNIML